MTFVLDTNVVLDLFVFADPRTAPLEAALQGRAIEWIATAAMRDELACVLAYPAFVTRLAGQGREAAAVLGAFDAHARLVETAPKAMFVCRDADDQKFIDLAVQHAATLLSKDLQVLALAKRLATVGVHVAQALQAPSPACARASG